MRIVAFTRKHPAREQGEGEQGSLALALAPSSKVHYNDAALPKRGLRAPSFSHGGEKPPPQAHFPLDKF